MLKLEKAILDLDKSIFILDAESVGALRANQMSLDEFGNIIFATRAEVYKEINIEDNDKIDSHPVMVKNDRDDGYGLSEALEYRLSKTEINDAYLASMEKFNNISNLDKKTVMLKHCTYSRLLKINSFGTYISMSYQDFVNGFIPYNSEMLDSNIYYSDADFNKNVIVDKNSIDIKNEFIVVKNKLLMVLNKETIGDLLAGNTEVLVNLYEEMLSKLTSTNNNVYQNNLFYAYLKL